MADNSTVDSNFENKENVPPPKTSHNNQLIRSNFFGTTVIKKSLTTTTLRDITAIPVQNLPSQNTDQIERAALEKHYFGCTNKVLEKENVPSTISLVQQTKCNSAQVTCSPIVVQSDNLDTSAKSKNTLEDNTNQVQEELNDSFNDFEVNVEDEETSTSADELDRMSDTQRNAIINYIETETVSGVNTSKAITTLGCVGLEQIMTLEVFTSQRVRTCLQRLILKPKSLSWLQQIVDTTAPTTWRKLTESIEKERPNALVEAQNTEFKPKCVYDNDDSLIQFIFQEFGANLAEIDGVKLIKRMKNSISKNCYNMFNRICKHIYGQTPDYLAMVTAKRLVSAERASAKKTRMNELPVNTTRPAVQEIVNGTLSIVNNTNHILNQVDANKAHAVPNSNINSSSSSSSSSSSGALHRNLSDGIGTKPSTSVFLQSLSSPTSSPERNDTARILDKSRFEKRKKENFDLDRLSVNSSDDEDDSNALGPRVSVGVLGASLLDLLPFTLYRDEISNVSLMVGESTPYAMLQHSNEAPSPDHITMIIGGGGTGEALDLLFGLTLVLQLTNYVGKSSHLKSMTFLQPSEYESRPELFQDIILKCLPVDWVCTVLTFHYGSHKRGGIDERVLCVFTAAAPDMTHHLTIEQTETISAAYHRCKTLFGSMELASGVHCLPLDVVLELVRLINIQRNHVTWEIGCGELLLAFGLSCAAQGGTVVATDLFPVVESLRENIELQKASRSSRSEITVKIGLESDPNKLLNDAVQRQEAAHKRSRLQRSFSTTKRKRIADDESDKEDEFLNEHLNTCGEIPTQRKTDSIFGDDTSDSECSDTEVFRKKFRKTLKKWEEASDEDDSDVSGAENNEEEEEQARDSDNDFIDDEEYSPDHSTCYTNSDIILTQHLNKTDQPISTRPSCTVIDESEAEFV